MPRFPSVEWFEAVSAAYTADRERVKRLGYLETTVGVLVEAGASSDGFVLDFAGYDVRPRTSADPAPESDFTIAGDLASWREMLESIHANGAADLDHTLNRLTMAGTPLRLVADDQLKLDLFFRLNQSFQAFFDGSAGVATQYASLATA